MRNSIPYNKSEHGELMANWLPHHDASDVWEFQGIFHESLLDQAAYAWRLSIYKVNHSFEPFCTVHYSLSDTMKGNSHSERLVVPLTAGKSSQISIDEDSLFCGDHVQILDTEHAIVVCLRGNNFGIDLRLDKDETPVWLGDENEKVLLMPGKKMSKSIFAGILPRMRTFGRLYIDDRDMRVEGVSSLIRSWGKLPIKNAKMHWEKFYLFFEDGGEACLLNLPFQPDHKEGIYIPDRGEAVPCDEFTFEPLEYVEIDEWRFSSLWRLTIPALSKEPYYLVPMIKSQFTMPVCRPFIGVFDKDGRCYGYGHCELMPGARNELDKISLRLYKTSNI